MHPAARRLWTRKRLVAWLLWTVPFSAMFMALALVAAALFGLSPNHPLRALVPLVPILIAVVFALTGSALGWLPGSRRPKPGAACRACAYDLAAHLPGDGIGIRCPECGHYNRFREPKPTLSAGGAPEAP